MKNIILKIEVWIVLFAFTACAGVKENIEVSEPYSNLFGVKVANSIERNCRHMPFVVSSNNLTTCEINASAKTIHFLGMINAGFDRGGDHWSGHPEKNNPRNDLFCIGDKIGDLKIVYVDETVDTIPLIFGATVWNFFQSRLRQSKEPFLSKADCAAVFSNCFKLKEDDLVLNPLNARSSYFLSVKPREKIISRVEISDNLSVPGIPLLTGITLDSPFPTTNFISFTPRNIPESERNFTVESYNINGWSNELAAVVEKLYTCESDLPKNIELIKYPAELNATKIAINFCIITETITTRRMVHRTLI